MFLEEDLSFVESAPEGTEVIRRVRSPLTEAVEFVMRSEITHAPSCVLIFKAARQQEAVTAQFTQVDSLSPVLGNGAIGWEVMMPKLPITAQSISKASTGHRPLSDSTSCTSCITPRGTQTTSTVRSPTALCLMPRGT